MRLTLSSQALLFEQGVVSILSVQRPGAMPTVLSSPPTLVENVVESLPLTHSDDLLVWIRDCRIRWTGSGEQRRVDIYPVRVSITDEDLRRGSTSVEIDPSFVRLQFGGEQWTPERSHVMGISSKFGTVEVHLRDKYVLDLLLDPGEYVAYVSTPPPVWKRFIVSPGHDEITTIILTPGEASAS